MSSYIPIFNRRQSNLPVNDFSGFEDISDTEEDSFSNDQQQQQQQSNTISTTSNRPREDQLNSRNQQSSSSSSTSSFNTISTTTNNNINSIPGGYDFEPQLNESGPSSSANTTSRSRSSLNSRRNTSNNAISNSTVTSNNNNDNNNNRNQLLSLSERLLPSSIYNRIAPTFNSNVSDSTREDHGLLFGQEEGIEEELDHDEFITREDRSNQSTYPPRGTASHIPLPSRPPSFIPTSNGANGGRIFGGGQSNDGVFANLAAKPEGARRYGGGEFVGGDDAGGDKDEVPPSYEAAALDSTPPYWETTIITPGGALGPDDICVDGLPVGNFFGFAWNMLVSMSFQFVGFLLTYLLHTTHAAKNGSRAGLGITLIQLGLYVKQRAEHPEYMMDGTPGDATGLEGSLGGSDSAGTLSWWGSPDPIDLATPTLDTLGSIPTQISTALGMGLESSGLNGNGVGVSATTTQSLGNFRGEQVMRMSEGANEYMAFFLVILGSFLLVGGLLNYWRAVRWAKAVRQDMGSAAAAV